MAEDTERTMGLDVGDRLSHYVVLDGQGAKVAQGAVATTPKAMSQLFVEQGPDTKIVLEVGTHSRWISKLARDLGRDVLVAQARRLEGLSPHRKKNDRQDAYTLAELGRTRSALLRPVHHRSEKAQAALAVVRSRDALVHSSTQLINHVRGVIKSAGRRVPSATRPTFAAQARTVLSPELAPALEQVLVQIESLAKGIQALEKTIRALMKESFPEALRLEKVDGVGPLTALTFVLTLEDPQRFRKSRDVGPYLGLVPRQYQSGESDPELSISKAGDPFLRRLLIQCAHALLHKGSHTTLGQWALRRIEGTGTSQKKRIVVALARKIAVLLHRLWAKGSEYDPRYGLPPPTPPAPAAA